jgi:DNA polymerase/3'-5' exonuclease PolX
MLLQELKEQVSKLPASDRLALVSAIIESLQSLQEDTPISETERSGAIRRMRGLLKTEQPAPTDEEVAAMLEERRAEKYLR